MWVRALSLLACFALLFLSACHKKPLQPTRANEIRWLVGELPHNLVWNRETVSENRKFLALVMQGLTQLRWQSKSWQIAPSLATQWSYSSPTQIAINLRKNVRWTNGKTLTSFHFAMAWKRLLEQPNQHRKLLFPIKNARAFARGRKPFSQVGIHTPSPFRLVLDLDSPSPRFLARLSHPATWPIFELNHPFAQTLGPYQINVWEAQRAQLLPNPHYFAPAKHSNAQWTIRKVQSSSMRIDMFLGGEAELVDQISARYLPLLQGKKETRFNQSLRLTALILPAAKSAGYTLQTRKHLLDALSPVQKQWMKHWPHDAADSLTSYPLTESFKLWPSNVFPGFLAKQKPSSLRRPLQKLSLQHDGSVIEQEIAKNIQAQWAKQLGLALVLKVRIPSKPDTASQMRLLTRNLQPTHPLGGSSFLNPGELFKLTGWQSSQYYRKYWKARRESRPNTMLSLMTELEKTISKKQRLMVPLYYQADTVLIRKHLTDLVWNPQGYWEFPAKS